MSLESGIAELNALIPQLIAALQGSGHLPAAADKPAKEPAAPANVTAVAGAALDYVRDVKPLALKVAQEKGREKLIAILGEFKVTQANLLKPEQWPAFVTACNKALA